MRYELFVYDAKSEELIHNQQAALADLISYVIDLDYESGYEFAPWVIMQKPAEGGSWECYWSEGGGQALHYKKIMEEE